MTCNEHRSNAAVDEELAQFGITGLARILSGENAGTGLFGGRVEAMDSVGDDERLIVSSSRNVPAFRWNDVRGKGLGRGAVWSSPFA